MNPDTLIRPAARTAPPSDSSRRLPQSESERTSTPVEEAKKNVGDQVKHVVEDLKEGGAESLQAAKDAGCGFVQTQQEKIATRLEEYTDAVKAACESLEHDDGNPLAGPAKSASRQLERAANYLRQKDASDIMDDLGTLARKKPEIVYGAMFVAGLAAVRFLKASSKGNGNGNRQFSSHSDDGRDVRQPYGTQSPPNEWSPTPIPSEHATHVSNSNSASIS